MGDLMRVRAVSSGYTGGPGVSTFFFASAAAPLSDASAVLATNRVRDAFTAGAALFPAAWRLDVQGPVDLVDEATGHLTGSLNGNASTIPGNSSVSTEAPAPVGLMISWNTAGVSGTHRVKGKTFLVPVNSQADAQNGQPSALGVSRAQTIAGAMTSPGTTDIIFGIYARPFAGRPAGPGGPAIPARVGSFHGVTGSSVKTKFVVLRSRRD